MLGVWLVWATKTEEILLELAGLVTRHWPWS